MRRARSIFFEVWSDGVPSPAPLTSQTPVLHDRDPAKPLDHVGYSESSLQVPDAISHGSLGQRALKALRNAQILVAAVDMAMLENTNLYAVVVNARIAIICILSWRAFRGEATILRDQCQARLFIEGISTPHAEM